MRPPQLSPTPPFAAQTVAGIRVEGNAICTVVEAGYATGESRDKRSWSQKRCSMTSQKWYTKKRVSYIT